MRLTTLLGTLFLSACAIRPIPQPATAPGTPPAAAQSSSSSAAAPWEASDWSALPGWQSDDPAQAWSAFLASCRSLRGAEMQRAWRSICDEARALGEMPATAQVRSFLEARLQPWSVRNPDGSASGLVTGYYEPLIRGSRTRDLRYRFPVFGIPDDLITVDLADLYPDLRGMRLRGRLDGRTLRPYPSRAQIDAAGESLPARVLLYTDDAMALAFLHVQGSGQAELPDGTRVRIAYADQNGHPYKAIGRWLADRGEIPLAEVSMQRILDWAQANPARIPELLASNPSYIFFREEAARGEGPRGALGVPLTAGRSIAIDPRALPLGAPLFIATTMPDGSPLERLVLAQDTGGAIRGRVRADFFYGFGAEAGALAGRMKQSGQLWLLWPRGATPASP